jgi:hypothetical protein
METLRSRKRATQRYTQIWDWRRAATIAASFLLLAPLLAAQYTAPYVSLTGVIASANGMPARNYILSLCPTQAMFVGGTAVVVNCAVGATDANGQLVGVANPLTAPVTAPIVGTGTVPAGNYYIKISWYDNYGMQTLPSVEAAQQLTAAGSITISPPVVGAPSNAVGMNVYIGTTPGGETYQGQTTSPTATFTQATAITNTGAIAPIQNNTVMQVVANDAAWPIAGYNATLTTAAGNTVPGFPQQWQLVGPGSAYNLSNGLPLYNGRVTYPVPVLTLPYNHNAQSISGPLSLTGYNVYNVGALGVGTALPAWGVDVEGTGAAAAINANQGYLVNGGGGTAGECLGSDGTYFDTPTGCVGASGAFTSDGMIFAASASALASTSVPTTSGHTFVAAWQPAGSAVAPTVLDLGNYVNALLPPTPACVTCTWHKQVFTTSGTFTIPTSTTATAFKWTIAGGGGAGGGGASGVSGAGGGAGATAYVLSTGYTAGNTITVTVGAGGTAITGATGNAGTPSSIASGTQTITTVTAHPGTGGGGGNSPAGNPAGVGGTVSNGDADSTDGGDGATGVSNSASEGSVGGSSSFGGGGFGGVGGSNNNGNAGEAWGSGGGGGSSNVATIGGAGAAGIVIVEWFY